MAARMSRADKKWALLLDGVRGDNLEKLLYDHVSERSVMSREFEQVTKRVELLESRMQTAKRYLGIVRYDAFEDVGGEQSFALAFFDELGHGAIITGVVGRSTSRVYCKEIVDGKATKDLSKEEQQAIELAASNRARTLQTTR